MLEKLVGQHILLGFYVNSYYKPFLILRLENGLYGIEFPQKDIVIVEESMYDDVKLIIPLHVDIKYQETEEFKQLNIFIVDTNELVAGICYKKHSEGDGCHPFLYGGLSAMYYSLAFVDIEKINERNGTVTLQYKSSAERQITVHLSNESCMENIYAWENGVFIPIKK